MTCFYKTIANQCVLELMALVGDGPHTYIRWVAAISMLHVASLEKVVLVFHSGQ